MALTGLAMISALLLQRPDSAASRSDGGIRLSGWVTTSITSSTRPEGRSVVGRMYGGREARIVLNLADLAIERVPAVDRWDAGFRIEPILGTSARIVRAGGLDLGRDADLWQAYAELSLPVNEATTVGIRAGKMATLMGVEGFADYANPTVDPGAQDIFLEPFSETGVQLQIHTAIDLQLRLSRGWDRVSDNNGNATVTARATFSASTSASVMVLGYSGREQTAPGSPARSGAELIVSGRLSGRAAVWMQLDYGQEGKATWHAYGLWLDYKASQQAGFGIRTDFVCDCDGVRTSGALGFPLQTGQRLRSIAATLNLRRGPHLMLRPEIRLDRSSLPVFQGHREQMTGALALSLIL
ncbi:MAG TPA: outer membrane beta-barrel protein [Gemmatimonadales bacterium]|nr:outer membrane beta-barrel protein [Gemmatimonadales bacterium]